MCIPPAGGHGEGPIGYYPDRPFCRIIQNGATMPLNASQRPKRGARHMAFRRKVNRRRSARRFNSRAGKTHPLNIANPLRGGIRL